MRSLVALSIILFLVTNVQADPFTYHAPGSILPGSGGKDLSTGYIDYEVHVPGIRFPLQTAPVFANSQVYNKKGGEMCDAGNYHYPWRDNFCEKRDDSDHDIPHCLSGYGHQGQDIRPSTCVSDIHLVVAAEEGVVTKARLGVLVVRSLDERTYYEYLHMSTTGKVGGKPTTINPRVGDKVVRGQPLGFVSTIQGMVGGTTRHLHFGIQQKVRDSKGGYLYNGRYVYVSPYLSLVRAYEALLGETGTELARPVVCTPGSTRCVPVDSLTKTALITCDATGTRETLEWCSGKTCASSTSCSKGTSPSPPDMRSSSPDLSHPPLSPCRSGILPTIVWTARRSLPSHGPNATGVALREQLHVFGGSNAYQHRVYDPGADTWTEKNALPFVLSTTGGAVVLDTLYGFALDGGGKTLRYNSGADSWTVLGSVSLPRTYPAVASLGNQIYLVGGLSTDVNKVTVYDTLRNSWATLRDRTYGGNATATPYHNHLYVFGGDSDPGVATRYDPVTTTWTTLARIPLERFGTRAVVRYNLIWLFGGQYKVGALPSAEIYLYDPEADVWCQPSGTMPEALLRPIVVEIAGRFFLLSDTGSLWQGEVY